MTYGAPLPGIRQRPTLDNLREPRVPILSSNSNAKSPSNHSYPLRTPNDYAPSISSQISQNSEIEFAPDLSEPHQSSNHRRKTKESTDIFGYASSSSQAKPANVTNNDIKGKPPGKSKSRLHISLGRLGRSKKEPPPEPARLREHTEFRVSNPMFTRENISARNYDAFFESGEPVYSLEYHTPVTTPFTSLDSDTLDNEFGQIAPRPHSFGFFTRSSKATTNKNQNRNSEPTSVVAQKGDRCLLTQ